MRCACIMQRRDCGTKGPTIFGQISNQNASHYSTCLTSTFPSILFGFKCIPFSLQSTLGKMGF